MVSSGELQHWRELVQRLHRGPAPRGEQFDLCRRVIVAAPSSTEAVQAARLLLEGAMADAATDIGDAQDVMRLLKAIGRAEVALEQLLSPP
ncbi:MAG: hypothetical protein ACHQQS_16295 [Thermoanaerobaculales bacterium]